MIYTINIHSIVDVITNSSTVIFTYQNNVNEAKELVQEMLNLMGETEKTADDIFYYAIMCEDDVYMEAEDYGFDPPEGMPTDYQEQQAWFENLKIQVIKGEIERPQWMIDIEEGEHYYDYYAPPCYLNIIPKEDKYAVLAEKLLRFLNSPEHEASHDG